MTSVKFSCIRFNQAQQVNTWDDSIVAVDKDYTVLTEETLPDCFESYHWFELVSFGWTGGARSRVKKLPAEYVLPYLNKLVLGKWIDDDEYNRAWMIVEGLMHKNAIILARTCPSLRWLGSEKDRVYVEREESTSSQQTELDL